MAAEVAEDYRQALEDLTMNSRIEIATLTNIARENANHGLAIAEVLQNHIKKAPPSRTLPALYVLDSVVKNVPTPYALYFGPKLYSIFMGAYTKVDNATRRKMDEMLKTWKEPVPGSISTKPVFPIEQVRPIENALMAARNAAFAAQQSSFQGQQQFLRGRAPVPSRDTPTPPTVRPYQPPPHGQAPFPGPNGQYPDAALAQQPHPMRPVNGVNVLPHRATPQPAPPAGAHPPHQLPAGRDVYGTPQAGISIDKLKDDIQQLIVAEKAEFAQDPLDTSKQTRLKALLDLQTVIQSQDMPQDQLMLIRDRVAELAVNMRSRSQPRPAVTAGPAAGAAAAPHITPAVGIPYHTPTPPAVSQQPTPVPPAALAVVAAALGRPPSAAPVPTPAVPPTAPPAAPPTAAGGGNVSIDTLFGQGALATLLAGAARNSATPQQAPTPQPPPAVPAPAAAIPRSPPPQRPAEAPKPAAAPPADPSALLAMLRQSGLIGSSAASAPAAPVAPGLPGMGGFPSAPDAGPELKPASLKIFRPHLIAQLHEDLGPPCTQCGRRFKTDEEGRRKKTAHMDWHFRVHQRITEAEKRGQHRSWYVDELDWIRSREAIDTDYVAPQDPSSSPSPAGLTAAEGNLLLAAAGGGSGRGGGASSSLSPSPSSSGAAARLQYLPVPEDSSRVNGACPICQERFEMKWLDDAQEWVWTDAVRVGDRVYHGTCHREAAASIGYGGGGGGGGQGNQRPTPERVLGKRKAEDEVGGLRGKMKMEGY